MVRGLIFFFTISTLIAYLFSILYILLVPTILLILIMYKTYKDISERDIEMQHEVALTNTKFKPTFLETQAGTRYTNTFKYTMITSSLKSIVTFLAPGKC